MRLKRVMPVAVLLAALAPFAAGAKPRSAPSVSVTMTMTAMAHRSSGTFCSSGGRYCAGVGCTIAPVLPVTNDQISVVPYSSCEMHVDVIISGRATSKGRPLARTLVFVRGATTDAAQCWPDVWVATVTACKTATHRGPAVTPIQTDANGSFVATVPIAVYQAGRRDLPVDALGVCKDIPVTAGIKAGATTAIKAATLRACA